MAKKTSYTRQRHISPPCHQNTSSAFTKYWVSTLFSTQQDKAMVHTEQLVEMLLNYVATYHNDGVIYCLGAAIEITIKK
jgi:hypothetical protein